jgi:hypothetical protein
MLPLAYQRIVLPLNPSITALARSLPGKQL